MDKIATYQKRANDYLEYFSAQVKQGKSSSLSRLEVLAIQMFAEWLDGQESTTNPPPLRPIENPNGITLRELKDFLAPLPDANEDGEDFEVWIETGPNLSSPVIEIWPLNKRADGCDVELASGLYRESES